MQIIIGKEWVIYSTKNACGIILAKIPKDKIGQDLDVSKISATAKYHYSTVFGAINGLFKYGIADSEAKSLLELEKDIQRLANQCEKVFNQLQRTK